MRSHAIMTALPSTSLPPAISLPPLKNLVQMLQLYESRLAGLENAVDISWIARLFDAEMQALWHFGQDVPRRAACLRDALRLRPVPVAAFAPIANRLALLDAAMLRQALAARALFARRAALRRCVDRRVMQPLRSLIGAEAFQILLGEADGCPGTSEADSAIAGSGLTGGDWALGGYAFFKRDGVWTDPALRTLIRVSLPVTASVKLLGMTGNARDGESAAFLRRLPTLFPERAWLFG